MSDNEHAIGNAKAWLESIHEMVGRLKSEDDEISEAAREEIQQSALSVMVRSGWYAPGAAREEIEAEEFEVLLSTGGPALRIFGDIGGREPDLQWQDWGTPWTSMRLDGEDFAAVQEFVDCFCLEA